MSLTCMECGEKTIGRADKKFCTDQCRTQYHNRSLIIENQKMRRVNNALRRNRRILSEFLGENEFLRISREKLLVRGFDFTFHTQQMKAQKGPSWLIIYDFGCRMEEKEEILISRIEKINSLSV